MNSDKKQETYIKPSRVEILRSVTTSTALETGHSSEKLASSFEDKRKQYAHLRLAT
ncbi:hypothetical protein [Thorsellia kenyensis]|uniref:Uncharacterized protein n=1 Tax=Thorsellia kenyensis TaxID=1549888 RepID=A0ABV6CCC7_9GAMM